MTKIVNQTEGELSKAVKSILAQMFVDYSEVRVTREIGDGFHGRIFLIVPTKGGEQELTAVVKFAPIEKIEAEVAAYERYVAGKLLDVPQLGGVSVSDDQVWAGLRYTYIGGGIAQIESLSHFLQQVEDEESLQETVNRLFQQYLEPWWRKRTETIAGLRVQDVYSWVLPASLCVVVDEHVPESVATLYEISEKQMPPTLPMGTWVTLYGGVVLKVEDDRQRVLLRLNGIANGVLPTMYNVWLEGETADYQVGQEIAEISGQVVNDQRSLLRAYAQRALPPLLLEADMVKIPQSDITLPNPLEQLPNYLGKPLERVQVTRIHGDLNLENVILRKATKNIHLIDFGATRMGATLHDFLRLESDIIIKWLPQVMDRAGGRLLDLVTFFQGLHQVQLGQQVSSYPPYLQRPFAVLSILRQWVQRQWQNWDDYYVGLSCYLLGTLRYHTLDSFYMNPHPKEVAFFSAAIVQSAKLFHETAPTAAPPPSRDKETQKRQMFEVLKGRFSLSDIANLLFRFNRTLEDLPVGAREDKARDLIIYFENRLQLDEVEAAMRELRPDVEW